MPDRGIMAGGDQQAYLLVILRTAMDSVSVGASVCVSVLGRSGSMLVLKMVHGAGGER